MNEADGESREVWNEGGAFIGIKGGMRSVSY